MPFFREDEDISLTHIEAKQRLDRLGNIRVAIQRGSTYYLEEPESIDLSSQCLERRESSKLRALGLTHAVKYTDLILTLCLD